jgi:DNA-binding CsgD family transcriptional regulator
MLSGYSPEVSGEKLGIALKTVRWHHKNIYKKLDVGSQTDVFSLFINAMSCLAPDMTS